MVKIEPSLFNKVWGSVGENTFKTYTDKRKIIMTYKKPIPSYTRTTAQDQQRTKFTQAVAQWNALTETEKQQYEEQAQGTGLTGYQYFIKQKLLEVVTGIWYKVTIDNTGNSNSLTDYQILINISGDAQFFSDAQDKREAIRIYDSDKATALAYWIEEWDTTNKNAKIWVKVQSITANSTKTIYISVDPSRTADASDGDATFLFFDDFNGTAGSQPDSNKWILYKKGSTNAVVKLDGNGNLHLAGEQNVISSGNVKSTATFTNGIAIMVKHKIDDEHYADVSLGSGDLQDLAGGTSDWWHTTLGNGYCWAWQSPVSGGSSVDIALLKTPAGSSNTHLKDYDGGSLTTLNEWHVLQYVYDENGNLKWYHDGSLMDSMEATDTTYLNDGKYILLSQGEYSSGNGGNRYIDWVAVRKYSSTAPSISYTKE